jgi:hypothetical protein
MVGANNWCMVKCSTPGCTAPEWLMHWPCQGSEDEIRNGEHFCGECWAKAWEAECEADPVRNYPVKRYANVEVRKGDRVLTKSAIVTETKIEIKDKKRKFENG